MRDTVLPQAQSAARRVRQSDVAGAVEPDRQWHRGDSPAALNGFNVDVGGLSPGNTVQFTYTDNSNVQHTITVVDTPAGQSLPQQASASNPNNTTIGIDFSAGMSSVVSQLNLQFGSNLQFANPSGTLLQVVNANGSGNVVNSLSATSTVTSLTSGSPQLQLFVDGTQPITGALTSTGGIADHGARRPHQRQCARWSIRPEPGGLFGDHDRRRCDAAEFHAEPDETASLTYSATSGIGTRESAV